MSNSRPETRGYKHSALCACAGAFQTPLRARDNCIGVGALSRHRRWRGLGAFVCDGIARETVEGRGAVSGSLAGMFRARRRASKLVGKRWQFSKLPADPVRLGHRAQRGLAQTVRFPLDPSRRGGGRQGGQRTRSGRAGAWANSSQKLAVFGTTLAVGPARAAAHRTASAGAELVDKSRHFGGGGGRNGR